MTYDIFISYRRDAYETANVFATRLKALGYRVFFDIETMNAGKFNEQLLDVISKCKDFILVLSPNALDRCHEEEDWVRREVLCAMENKKNIIPIMLSGFTWPNEMPKGMEELCNYQAIAPTPNIYYDLQIQRLTGYLKSKAYVNIRKRWLIGIGGLLAIFAILITSMHFTYIPVAKQVADKMTVQMQCENDLANLSVYLQVEWEKYVEDYKKCKTVEDQEILKSDIQKTIDSQEKQMDALVKKLKASPVEVKSIYYPVFRYHDINPVELEYYNTNAEIVFDEFQNHLDYYRALLEEDDYTPLSLRLTRLNSNVVLAFTASDYYGYLQILSHLPKSAHEMFNKVSPEWNCLPKTGIGLSDEEYARQQSIATGDIEKELKIIKVLVDCSEAELDEIEQHLQELEDNAELLDTYLNSLDAAQE